MIQFGLFLVVNAVLILRPTDLISELDRTPIYEIAILLALATSAPQMVGQLAPAVLIARPVTLFVLGMLVAVLASHLVQFKTATAQEAGFMYFKIVLYYLLLITNVRTLPSLQTFIQFIIVAMFVHVCLSLLQYFEYIDVEALRSFQEKELDPTTGSFRALPRLRGAGIFNDPNEFCVLLAVASLLCLYLLGDRRAGPVRFGWCVPLAAFAWGIPLTYSRGGMLALLVGLGVLAAVRYGWRRGLLILSLILPVVGVGLAGRQTKVSFDDPSDTSQHRLRLWSDGLIMFRESPVFGVGQGVYAEFAGQVAHNSFIEAYAELGILGGTCFAAAVAYPFWGLWRVRRKLRYVRSTSLKRLHPFMFAVLVAQTTGMMSLSRLYTPSTYLVMGLVAVYLQLLTRAIPGAVPYLTQARMVRLALAGMVLLMSLQLFTMLFTRWS